MIRELTPEQRATAGRLLKSGIECNQIVTCDVAEDARVQLNPDDRDWSGWMKAAIMLIGGTGIVTIELTDDQLLDALSQVMESTSGLASDAKRLLDSITNIEEAS